MRALLDLIEKGGPAMIAIIALSVVLYSRCFMLIASLFRTRRQLKAAIPQPGGSLPNAGLLRKDIQESFQQQRIGLGSMIAAAPLLGLLGTVSGMVKTFESLSEKTRIESMEGLARGISEVLVATESGLLVAIPALLFVYLAHREVRRLVGTINKFDPAVGRSGP